MDEVPKENMEPKRPDIKSVYYIIYKVKKQAKLLS